KGLRWPSASLEKSYRSSHYISHTPMADVSHYHKHASSILICNRQFFRWIERNDFRAIRCEHHHLFDARRRYSIRCRAECFNSEHHAGFQLIRLGERIESRNQRPFVKTKTETMAEVQTECRHLALEVDVGSLGQLFGSFVGAESGLQHLDRVVHPLAGALV